MQILKNNFHEFNKFKPIQKKFNLQNENSTLLYIEMLCSAQKLRTEIDIKWSVLLVMCEI